jgi:hypothetical protein
MSAKADGARIRREKANLGVVLAVGKGARRPAPCGSPGRRRLSVFRRREGAPVRAGSGVRRFLFVLGGCGARGQAAGRGAALRAMRRRCAAVAWDGGCAGVPAASGSRSRRCPAGTPRIRHVRGRFGLRGSGVLGRRRRRRRRRGRPARRRCPSFGMEEAPEAPSCRDRTHQGQALPPSRAAQGPRGNGSPACRSKFSGVFPRPAATSLDEARRLSTRPDLETCRGAPAARLSGLADAAADRTGLPGGPCVRSVPLSDMDRS